MCPQGGTGPQACGNNKDKSWAYPVFTFARHHLQNLTDRNSPNSHNIKFHNSFYFANTETEAERENSLFLYQTLSSNHQTTSRVPGASLIRDPTSKAG